MRVTGRIQQLDKDTYFVIPDGVVFTNDSKRNGFITRELNKIIRSGILARLWIGEKGVLLSVGSNGH